MIFDGYVHQIPDIDPDETMEWLDSLDAVVDARGKTRARFLLTKLLERAQESQVSFPATVSTPYVNTIPREQEPWFPGDEHIERRIRAFVRWNAAMMVVKANKHAEGIGGHLSTFASSALVVRDRVQPLLPRQGRRQRRRRRVLPGPRRARHLRPGVHGGPPDRPTTSTTSAARSGATTVACRATRTRG